MTEKKKYKKYIDKKRKNLIEAILIGSLGLTGGISKYSELHKKNPRDNYNKNEKNVLKDAYKSHKQDLEERSSEEIIPPYYKLNNHECAKYARLSAEKLFQKEYSRGDAWNIGYTNKIVHKISSGETLEELISNDILKPGMIVGIEQPKSIFKNRIDLKGHKAKYTHVILYVGLNDKEEPEFIEQYGRNIDKISKKDFKKRHFTPKEIIDVYPQKN